MITFDPETGVLMNMNKIVLSKTYSLILSLLVKHQGRVVSYETIYNFLYLHKPTANWPQTTIIRVFLTNIRKRLASIGAPNAIKTHHGRGLELTVPIGVIECEDENDDE